MVRENRLRPRGSPEFITERRTSTPGIASRDVIGLGTCLRHMGIQIRIAEHSAVQMHYHLTTDNGDTVDSSKGRQPLEYLHGHGHLVSGVERALEGKETGDTFVVVLGGWLWPP